MTEKQNRSGGFGKRALSMILAILIVLSTLVVILTATSISTSAAISYWFVSGNFNGWTTTADSTNKISSGSGGSVTISLSGEYSSSIKFKMVAEENGQKWCGISGTSINPGTETELSWNNGNDINVSFSSTVTSATFTLAVKDGKNYITVTGNSSGGGGGGETGQMTFSAPVNTNNSANTDKDKIFWAKATYFDYLSDEELSNTKWLKPVQAGTGFNGSSDEWYPFYRFNREVVKAKADSDSNWNIPLYFGNFCNVTNAYDTSHHPGVQNGFLDATGSYNVTRFNYAANNSNKDNANSDIGGTGINHNYDSYQGLMYSTLDANGNLLLPDQTTAPYFDSSESGALAGKAKVVNSMFPFTVEKKDNYTYYEFNSNGAEDNVYFTWATDGTLTKPMSVNYGAGTTYGVKDGISQFMYNSTSGYGIFPFNNASSNYKGTKTYANENLNYGFGVRIDVNFRVPTDTTDEIKFTFSGDDDLWMYITDNTTNVSQLVLDMGGSHCKSDGEVNFTTKKATVNNVYNSSTGTTSSVTKSFNFDYSHTYTMSVFYMERGLIESNMKMGFTMTPLGNNFIVTEKINTTDVNTGIVDAVKAISQFGFNTYDNGTQITDSTYKNFTLGDGDSINIPDSALPINSQPSMLQYAPTNSYLVYDTEWTYYDNESSKGQKQLSNGTGVTSKNSSQTTSTDSHTLINESGDEYDYAELQVDYVNTPQVSDVVITKDVVSTIASDLTKSFPVKVEVSLDGGSSYNVYPLVYTESGSSSSKTMSTTGKFNVANDKSYTISGLPIGAKVRVTETNTNNLVASYSPTNRIVTVSSSTQTVAITNTRSTITPATVELELSKTLTGATLEEGKFSFTLTEVNQTGYNTGSIDTSQTATNDSDGKVKFSFTANPVAGTFLYAINETNGGDSEIEYDSDTVYAKVTIAFNSSQNKYYVSNTEYTAGTTFDNAFKTGEVTITKAVEGNAPSTDTFNINLSVVISSSYTGYADPYYTVDNSSTKYYFDTLGKATINVSAGTVINVKDLPLNSLVTVSEDTYDAYTTTYIVGNDTNVGSSVLAVGSSVTVNNKYAPATADIKAKKTLTTDAVLAGKKAENFSFTLKNTSVPSGISLADDNTVNAGTDGSVAFDTITYTKAGVYEYTITEINSDNTMITNNTVYKAVVNVTKASASSDLTAAVTYYDSSNNSVNEANVVFENDVKKGNITITKILKDYDESIITDSTEFSITAAITYPNGTTDSQSFKLTSGSRKTISNLPYGTQVVVTETLEQGAPYTVTYKVDDTEATSDPATTTISKDLTAVTVTNKRSKPGTVTGKVTGTKTLDSTNYSGSLFKFELTGLAPFSGETGVIDTSSVSKSTDSVTNGAFEISGLEFSDPGTYRYKVVESLEKLASIDSENNTTYSSDIYKSNIEYLVVFTVENQIIGGQPTLVPSDPVYYEHDPSDTIDVNDFNVTAAASMSFRNFTQKGSIAVEKENQAGDKVEGVVFAVYAVDSSFISSLSDKTDEEKYNAIKELTAVKSDDTDSNGHAEINDLPIYTANYATAGGNPAYQQYAMIELSGPDGYNINKTVHTFSFPTIGDGGTPQYSYTFEYINGVLKTPTTAGPGMTIFKILGIILAILSMTALAGFLIYSKKAVKVRTGRHFK